MKEYRKKPKVKEKTSQYYKDWYKINGRKRSKAVFDACVRWQHKNPEKKAAHIILYYAIQAGKIIKPAICSQCGRKGLLSGHHTDYSKPLSVIWLCGSCHKFLHIEA